MLSAFCRRFTAEGQRAPEPISGLNSKNAPCKESEVDCLQRAFFYYN